MTVRSDRHYVRVYHDDLMRDYPAVYADDAALATWLRLLVIADKMWPTLAELPRSVKPGPLRALVTAGLVGLVGEHCYRIRGLDAERTQRRDAARNAAASRWRTADAVPSTEPSRADAESESEKVPIVPGKTAAREPSASGAADPWAGFGNEWTPFRAAMASRGFTRPPTVAQRDMLWAIVDGNRHRAAAWLLDAPAGASFPDVIGHVLREWRVLKASIPADPPAPTRMQGVHA